MQQIKETPQAALLFYWMSLDRQIRVEGTVAPITDEEANPEQKVLFKNAARLFGRLANAHRVSAHTPRIAQVLYGFIVATQRKEITGNLEVRPRLLATLKTSMINSCNY